MCTDFKHTLQTYTCCRCRPVPSSWTRRPHCFEKRLTLKRSHGKLVQAFFAFFAAFMAFFMAFLAGLAAAGAAAFFIAFFMAFMAPAFFIALAIAFEGKKENTKNTQPKRLQTDISESGTLMLRIGTLSVQSTHWVLVECEQHVCGIFHPKFVHSTREEHRDRQHPATAPHPQILPVARRQKNRVNNVLCASLGLGLQAQAHG